MEEAYYSAPHPRIWLSALAYLAQRFGGPAEVRKVAELPRFRYDSVNRLYEFVGRSAQVLNRMNVGPPQGPGAFGGRGMGRGRGMSGSYGRR